MPLRVMEKLRVKYQGALTTEVVEIKENPEASSLDMEPDMFLSVCMLFCNGLLLLFEKLALKCPSGMKGRRSGSQKGMGPVIKKQTAMFPSPTSPTAMMRSKRFFIVLNRWMRVVLSQAPL